MLSGSRKIEVTRFRRVAAVPVTAHAGGAGTAIGSANAHRLHHLPDVAIGQHHHGIAIAVGQVEGAAW